MEPVEKLSVGESREFIEKDSMKEARREYFKKNREFFQALNQWLEEERVEETM